MSPILQRLVSHREAVGLTQADVAARMGTSQPVVARLEGGGRDPRLSTLERYAAAIGGGLEVRFSARPTARSAARLAERIRDRMASTDERTTATFREVVQFLDEVSAVDAAEIRAAIRKAPATTGDARWDAVVAAAAERAASIGDIPAPRWTSAANRRLDDPWFVSADPRLHPLVRTNADADFARHGVYVDRDSLRSV